MTSKFETFSATSPDLTDILHHRNRSVAWRPPDPEVIAPKFKPMEDDPELHKEFKDWSALRQSFQASVAKIPPANPNDKWQKHYYRGTDASGCTHIEDHQAKLRLSPFQSE